MNQRRTVLVGTTLGLLLLTAPLVALSSQAPAGAPPHGEVPAATRSADEPAGPEALDEPEPPGEPTTTVASVWTQGGLEPRLVDAVLGLEDVEAATFVRSDTLRLTGSRDADGGVVDDLADGFVIAISVTAIDPETYLSVLVDPQDDPEAAARSPLGALRPGQAILSAVGAELRGLGVGGRLDIGDAVDLEVVAMLDDEGARRSEVFVHADDAALLGFEPNGSIQIRHRATSPEQRDALETRLRGLSDTETIRLRGGGPGPSVPLVLSLAQIKQTFGEFAHRPRGGREIELDREFLRDNIVTTRVPVFGNVTCHRAIIDDLVAAIEEVVEAGLEEHLAPSRYGGCHYPRRISLERARLSSHSWGIAVDINVDVDAPGLGPVPPDEFIEIFGRHGFRWGGDFTTPDNHHYEWIGEDAAVRPER